MIVWLFFLFVVSCSLGAIAGVDRNRRGRRTDGHIELQRLLQSKTLQIVLALGCLVLAPFAAACFSDELCQMLPIELQRNCEPMVWLLGIPMFGAFAGWFTSFALVSRDFQAGFVLRAMIIMSAVLMMTGFKANAEISQMLWNRFTSDGIMLQTSHFFGMEGTSSGRYRVASSDRWRRTWT